MAGSNKARRGPGVSPLAWQRQLYLRLVSQGMDNSKACREVGVNRRTGTRWRYGRTVVSPGGRQLHYPALTRPVISDRYLGQDERVAIADSAAAGLSVRRIAAELGRSPSTVSRELRRNHDPGTGQYRPFAAQQRAAGRRPRPKPRKLADPLLRQVVQDHLDKR